MISGPGTAPAIGAAAASGRGVPAERRPLSSASLLDAVADLRRDVDGTRFPLALDGVADAEALRRRLLDQIDDHLLPRLRAVSAPAIVVVAGSTGAGKSTLFNTLLGEEVSAAGVIRPTTRRPVLAHHPADTELIAAHPLLGIVDVVVRDVVPRGIALVDAPDLDSLLETNRATAHRLLDAADLCVFVTTAARYGDALPWAVLDRAAERTASLAMVLNRVPAQALVTVRGELMDRLRQRSMAAVPLFIIADLGPHQGMLEPASVAPIRRWLTMLAGPDRARSVIARTQRGSLRTLRPWVDRLAEAVQAQVDARIALETVVDKAVAVPARRASEAVAAGALAAGPVRARWAALAGPSGPLSGRWTSRRGRPARRQALEQVATEVRGAVVVAFQGAGRGGAAAVAAALSDTPAWGAAGIRDGLADASAEPLVGGRTVATTTTPEQSAGDWMLAAVQELRHLGGFTGRRAARGTARLLRAVGDDGAGALAAAAAVGLGSAAAALTSVLGDAAHDLVRRFGADLAARAAEQARAGADPARAVLATPDLADDAASRLRLRLAVLKGLV